MVTNAEVLRWFKQRDKLKTELKDLEKQILRLERRKEKLNEKLELVRQVGFVERGIAITTWSDGCRFQGVVPPYSERWGEIYPNAYNRGETWGLNLRNYGEEARRHSLPPGGSFRGAYWPNKEAAQKAAINWVIDETIPPVNGKEETKS